MTYMTNCKESCVSFIPSSSTEWFKISELGEMRPGDPGSWVQGKVALGSPVNVSLPLDLPAGEYLVRNEIISLQNAQTVGGAEYYPSCLQISLKLGGNVVASPTVHFPGAYSETDPGILGNVRRWQSCFWIFADETVVLQSWTELHVSGGSCVNFEGQVEQYRRHCDH